MSEMLQVLEKLSVIEKQNAAMNNKIDEMLLWKATLEERCSAHREKTEDIRKVVFDKDGLKVKVQQLLNCKGTLRDKMAIWQDFGMYVLKVLIVAGLLAAIGLMLKFYKMNGE